MQIKRSPFYSMAESRWDWHAQPTRTGFCLFLFISGFFLQLFHCPPICKDFILFCCLFSRYAIKAAPFFIDVKVCSAVFYSWCYPCAAYIFFIRFAMNKTLSFLQCRSGWRLFCIMHKFTVKTHIIQKKFYYMTIIIY